MIANSRTRRHASNTRRDVTIGDLLGMIIAPTLCWWRRQVLQARLRSLHGLADYFAWQEANGRAGLADTHRRIAVAKSDLNAIARPE